jgi:hypothetical protein
MTAQVESIAKQVYAEAADFFRRLTPAPAYGYKILNGPPLSPLPILFVGYQPGGAAPEDYSDRWPPVCQHATANWPLAQRMRQLFDKSLLEQCCGVNAIFVRAPNNDAYGKQYDRTLRAEIAEFCLPRVVRIVEALEAETTIVAIGHDTLRLFGHTEPRRESAAGRLLTITGRVADHDAIAMLHLTGARISAQDFRTISEDVLSFLQQHGTAVEATNGLICRLTVGAARPAPEPADSSPLAPQELSSNEMEAANRAEATALLIRAGYRVYRPEADVHGEDLILRDPSGPLLPVQLKGRPTVDWPRYGGKSIWMLFPDPQGRLGRPWYLVRHDVFFGWVKNRHCTAPGWQNKWSYPSLSTDLKEFLEEFRIPAGAWA